MSYHVTRNRLSEAAKRKGLAAQRPYFYSYLLTKY